MKRDECHKFHSTMRHVGKGDTLHGGHSPTRFYCPHCDEYRRRG